MIPITTSSTREEIIFETKRKRRFDVVVIGGGIHGACVARECALNGLSCLLLERSDYASETSSRSSKMLHGGLRYLAMLDFAQVFEGVQAREEYLVAAPHLAQAAQFLIPVPQGSWWYRAKMQLGLWLYDRFLTDKNRRHRWLEHPQLPELSFQIAGAFSYTDGVMNDTRIVHETILAARQEGALALNYAEVQSLEQTRSGEVIVGWFDRVGLESNEVRAGVVVNCAGQHVARVGRLTPAALEERIMYSVGAHLLFDFPWESGPLFLPIDASKNRYYWVWKHPGGTMVGTNERVIPGPLFDPQATEQDIEEILQRVQQHLPHLPFTRARLYKTFAGVRTLPLRRAKQGAVSAAVSRRHQFDFTAGILSLIGGKYTTAPFTAHELVQRIWKEAKLPGAPVRPGIRPLPGAMMSETDRATLVANLGEPVATALYHRLGRRALKALELSDRMLPHGFLEGEVLLARQEEQAVLLEDVLSRRLGASWLPHGGEGLISDELQKRAQLLLQLPTTGNR